MASFVWICKSKQLCCDCLLISKLLFSSPHCSTFIRKDRRRKKVKNDCSMILGRTFGVSLLTFLGCLHEVASEVEAQGEG